MRGHRRLVRTRGVLQRAIQISEIGRLTFLKQEYNQLVLLIKLIF